MSTKAKIIIGIISAILILTVAVIVSSRSANSAPSEENTEQAY